MSGDGGSPLFTHHSGSYIMVNSAAGTRDDDGLSVASEPGFFEINRSLFLRQGKEVPTDEIESYDLIVSDDDDEVRSLGAHPDQDKADDIISICSSEGDRTYHDNEQPAPPQFPAAILSHDAPPSLHRSPTKSYPHEVKTSDGNITYLNLKVGKSVLLKDGTFLRLTAISERLDGSLALRGRPLIKQGLRETMLPSSKGELLWKVQVVTSRNEPPYTIDEINVPLSEIKSVEQITFTNATYPNVSRETSPNGRRRYFCRRRFIQINLRRDQVDERVYENLRPDQADEQATFSESALRYHWRGATTLGGSESVVEPDTVTLDELDPAQNTISQRYTFGDVFCGGGGVSRGAQQAGLALKFGVDLDATAMQTYRRNFTPIGAIGLCMCVAQFLELAAHGSFQVDMLHLSPPCQPYSAAHTTSQNLQRDEDNQAVLFSTWQLVERLKPRIVTIEETEGLYARHPQYFYTLIHAFLHHGYSVRWRIVNTYHYGVPQSRRRIYLFAAGPGEKLPDFPRPTHGNEPGLRRFQTIHDAISRIPRNAQYHDTHVHFADGPRPAYSPDRPAFTLTCGGGENNYHPSGKRRYTVREMASLQTFPLSHHFCGNKTSAKRQIGNAVPPKLARTFLNACVESLKACDRVELAATAHLPETTPSTSPNHSSRTPNQDDMNGGSSDRPINID